MSTTVQDSLIRNLIVSLSTNSVQNVRVSKKRLVKTTFIKT